MNLTVNRNVTEYVRNAHFLNNVHFFIPELDKDYIPSYYNLEKRTNYKKKARYANFIFFLKNQDKLLHDISYYLEIVQSPSFYLLEKFSGKKQKIILSVIVDDRIREEISNLLIKFYKDDL